MPLSFVVGSSELKIYDGKQLLVTVLEGVSGPGVARHVRDPADVVRVVGAVDKLRRYMERASDKDERLHR